MAKQRYRVAEGAAWNGYEAGQDFEFDFEGSGFFERPLLEGGLLELLGEPTKEELLAKAKELEIEGRSNMSKEELKAAIEEAKIVPLGAS